MGCTVPGGETFKLCPDRFGPCDWHISEQKLSMEIENGKDEAKLNRIYFAIKDELDPAMLKFPRFVNAHEGWAVLMEEVDELWDVVKLNQKKPEREDLLTKEAIQVAAMAVRFLHDVCQI